MKKKIITIFSILLIATVLTGCGKDELVDTAKNLEKINLTGDLVTYVAYYHNVVEHEKRVGNKLTNIFEKKRELFAEYKGTIKLGINFSKVKIEADGNKIIVRIPPGMIIGEPNVDEEYFTKDKFIENKDGINPNPITINDFNDAMKKAQNNMKTDAEKDEKLLDMAQKRAKLIIEENIKQFISNSDILDNIEWKYEN